jgi:hypothetical protein
MIRRHGNITSPEICRDRWTSARLVDPPSFAHIGDARDLIAARERKEPGKRNRKINNGRTCYRL